MDDGGRKERGRFWRTARGLANALGVRDLVNRMAATYVKASRARAARKVSASLDREKASAEITAVILTVDPSHLFERCMASVRAQTLSAAHIEVVRNVTPFSMACQQALDAVNTPYFVMVDDDMLLYPSCFERLYSTMATEPKCAESLAHLMDPFMGDIKGVRMYRTEVARAIGFHPLEGEKGCERKMKEGINQRGWRSVDSHVVEGEHHPEYLPHEAFYKFKLAAEKFRYYEGKRCWSYGEMLDGIMAVWQASRDPVAIYALAGLFEGLQSEDVTGELNYEGRIEDPAFRRVKAFLEKAEI